ncbi:MAG: DUF1501 domain-containing protein [Acidobacteria bacterium]|nr:MAG: DUF1501 domain-containing protein [Acidobacteriota bacterium]
MKAKPCGLCSGGHYGRRDFLRLGALNFVGISLSQYLEAVSRAAAAGASAGAKAQSCILIWLDGGPSHIDTWDPKPNSAFKAIPSRVPGIQISELFPRLARQMDKISIIRSLRTEENNHGVAHHYAITGHRPNPSMKFPSLGSIITKEMQPRGAVPPYVIVPKMNSAYEEHFRAHFLGAEYDPMSVSAAKTSGEPEAARNGSPEFKLPDLSLPQSLTAATMEDRKSFLAIVDRLYRQKVAEAEHSDSDTFRERAWEMLLRPSVRRAFDLAEESAETRDAYGRHPTGQSALPARRRVAAGSRFVTASGSGGWDTHTNHDKSVKDKLANPLDQTLSALLADLAARGMLDSTIVLVMGEFGRTPDYNAKLGRDHWPNCWSVLLGGGGIQGGRIVGASDERGREVADRLVTIGDVFATIYRAFGIDWTKEYMHPIGRPLKIANSINDVTGSPVQELF